MGSWAQWTAKTALLAAGFAAAAGGLSGVALAAGGSAGSGAGPGLGLGRLVAPAGVCDNAGALLGVVGAACQVSTAVLPPAAPGQTAAGTANTPRAGSGQSAPGACGAGDTNVPAASQLAGLGALPGLADLPSRAGLANMPALNGVTGGGIPMPGTALSAASTSGMSSDSFAALAVGALLAGAS